MAWHQISVITTEDTAPQLADFFSHLGAVSVTYMDAEDEPVYEPAIGETKIWSNTQVIALYELDANPELISYEILKILQDDQYREKMLANLALIPEKLGNLDGASNVAKIALKMLNSDG